MKGIYVLLIRLRDDASIDVGKLGTIEFSAGFYAYVGSALNGLEGRIKRHLRMEKKKHWHIDYLLEVASIEEVIYAETEESLECELADSLTELDVVERFGSSDCKCKSHLFFSDDFDGLKTAVYSGMNRCCLDANIYHSDL
ncbi:MAG: GIY-YIG nuclease family protein [Halobacteriota archaeon]|nr:GIY-YIG nuclease family protein [Halobacteriota archaeon]